MRTCEVNLRGQLPFTIAKAQAIVRVARSFSSRIFLRDARGTFNAKSLLGLLSLGTKNTGLMTLLADGPDEEEAVNKLCLLLSSPSERKQPV